MTKRRKTAKRRRSSKSVIPELNFELASHIAREMWAVIYLSLAALTWLSLNKQLGYLGDLWVSVLRPIFGVGVGAVPFALVFMGGSVFLSKKIEWGLARLTGMFLLAVAILGFVHMRIAPDDMLEVAQQGQAGGYIGFVSSFIFLSAFGKSGAYVLLTGTLLIGILLTLQVSLGAIIRFVTPSPKMVKKVIDVATPDFKIVDRDAEEGNLKIVKPQHYVEEETDSMTFKEVSMKEVEARLEEIQKKEEKAEKEDEHEDEVVLVKKAGAKEEEEETWEHPDIDLLEDSRETYSLNQSELKRQAEV
ncbi:MAG: DNA translocase FtsK 4TM domain-containing protein, partial [Patescibacteria group bacterium]